MILSDHRSKGKRRLNEGHAAGLTSPCPSLRSDARKGGEGVSAGQLKVGMNFGQLQKELDKMKGQSETALRRIVADARSRVPGWVATEVSGVYNIKKAEITPEKAGTGKKPAGSIKVQGDTVDSLQIVYRGRLLTPTHFGMTPKAPKDSYTLKAEIIRGNKAVLGQKKKLTKKQRANIGRNFTHQGTKNSPKSPIMLMRANGGQYLPFQRKSQNRNDLEAIKTISVPQMVSSDRTRDRINQAINEGLQKRVEHHLKNL